MIELIFIHLPKTGGSSLLQLLYAQYGEAHVRHFERDECLELNARGVKISDVLAPEIRVIHGHFFYKEVKDIIKRDKPKLVTFMRDPVKRVISNYHWWMHTIEEDPNHSERHRMNEPLEVYITRPEVRNKVTQFLDGSRLKKFTFIGFLENLDADVARLAKLLEWKNIEVKHEKNSQGFKKRTHTVGPELEKTIAQLNRKDMKLFKKAKALNFRI